MPEPEIAYRLTATGSLALDLAEKLESLLCEQRAAVCTLLQEAHLHLRRHECFPASVSLVEALTILGLMAGPPE